MNARRERDRVARLRLAEWQVKTVCGFIGAQAQIDTEKTGGKNPLVELAQAIDIMAGPSDLDAIRGEKVADDWRDDPRVAPQPADPDTGQEASNAAGSMEAFFLMMGGPPPPSPAAAS